MDMLISALSPFNAAVKSYCKLQSEELYDNLIRHFDIIHGAADSALDFSALNEVGTEQFNELFSSLTVILCDRRFRNSVYVTRSIQLISLFITDNSGNFLPLLCLHHDVVNLTINLLVKLAGELQNSDSNTAQSLITTVNSCFDILFAAFSSQVRFEVTAYNLQSLVEFLLQKIYKRNDELVDASLAVLAAVLTREDVASDVAKLLEKCSNLRAFAKALLKLSANSSSNSSAEEDVRILCCTLVLSFLHNSQTKRLEADADANSNSRQAGFGFACLSSDAFRNGVALFRNFLAVHLRQEASVARPRVQFDLSRCSSAFILRLYTAYLRYCAAEFIVSDETSQGEFARCSDLRNFLSQLMASLQRASSTGGADLLAAAATLVSTLHSWNLSAVAETIDSAVFSTPSAFNLLRRLVRFRKFQFAVQWSRLVTDFLARAGADGRLHDDAYQQLMSKWVGVLFENVSKAQSDAEDDLRNSCSMLGEAFDRFLLSRDVSRSIRNAFARAFADLDCGAICETLSCVCLVAIDALQSTADVNNNASRERLDCVSDCALKFARFIVGDHSESSNEMNTDEADFCGEMARRFAVVLEGEQVGKTVERITQFLMRLTAVSTGIAVNRSAIRCLFAVAKLNLAQNTVNLIAHGNAEANFIACKTNATPRKLDSQFLKLRLNAEERSRERDAGSVVTSSAASASSSASLSEEAKQVAVMSLYENELSALQMQVAGLEETIQSKNTALEQSERMANQSRCRLLQSEADLRKCRDLLRDTLSRLDETGSALAQVNERHSQSSQQLERANEQLNHLRAADSQKRELQLQCAALRQELEVSKRRVMTLEEENAELDRLKQSLIEHNERVRSQYDHVQAELARSEKERIEVASRFSALEMRFKEETTKLAASETSRNELARLRVELEEELEKRTVEFDQLRRSSIALSSENTEVKQRNADLLASVSDLRSKVKRLEDDNSQVNAELKKKDATLAMVKDLLHSQSASK